LPSYFPNTPHVENIFLPDTAVTIWTFLEVWNKAIGPDGLETKNDCAGEYQPYYSEGGLIKTTFITVAFRPSFFVRPFITKPWSVWDCFVKKGQVSTLEHIFFVWIPFYLKAVQIHSANGVKLLEARRGVLSNTPPYK
jgi:hypothetical protein